MNLIPNLSIIISRDGKSLIFEDKTLQDNQSTSTNYWNGVTTRYNNNISIATTNTLKPDKIDDVTMFITKPDTTIYSFPSFDVPVTTINYTITNSAISESGIIPDGVYNFEYILWNLLSVSVSGNINENIITFSSLPASLEIDQYLKFNVSDTTLYTITAIDSVTKTVTLDKNLEDTYTSYTSLYVGYRFYKPFLFDFSAKCCIDKTMAAAATKGCCNDCVSDELKSATNMFILLMGAHAQVNNGLEVEAQDTISTLNKLCNTQDVDCGCGK